MTNPLDKFHDLLSKNSLPTILWSSELTSSECNYCQEMVQQGKLDSFDCCSDNGENNSDTFSKIPLFYERNLSTARRKVYIYRLPFFGMSVSFKHSNIEFSYDNKIKVNKGNKEQAQKEATKLVGESFKMYIKFIRCWILKSYIDYESAYSILQHYSENDGIITVPEFLVNNLMKDLNINLIPIPTGGLIFKPIDIYTKIQPIIKCLNEGFQNVECPFCESKNISNGEMTTCSNCGKSFV